MQVLILSGGLGTRIRDVRDDIPKPMLPINDYPFLEYQLSYLKQQGLTDVVLCVGHLKEKIISYFGDGRQWDIDITYSEETEPLGTAGAVKNAESQVDTEHFFVLNGDSLFDGSLNQLLQFHRRKEALASIGLIPMDDTGRYGAVETDEENRVERFLEKDREGPGSVNGGIYLFHQSIFEKINRGEKVSMENEVFPQLIGERFYGYPLDEGYFIDIGIPEAYERAREEVPDHFTPISDFNE